MPWTRREFMGTTALAIACPWSLGKSPQDSPKKRIVFLAGKRSHGFGEHEHIAGCHLLASRLNALEGIEAGVIEERWPEDPKTLEGIQALVIFADGGGNHPLKGHDAEVQRLSRAGVGLGFMHYALIPTGEASYPHMLEWLGGYYEPWWSVNPIWDAKLEKLPEHSITRGVKPFEMRDEWYYHMRFAGEMKGVTPLLTAVPPDATREKKHGPHSGNPHVEKRKGEAEHLAWAYEGSGGQRGFGFTGGHWHWNWAHDGYRRFALNAIAWLAGIEVPAGGIASKRPTLDELVKALGKPPEKFDRSAIEKLLAGWA